MLRHRKPRKSLAISTLGLILAHLPFKYLDLKPIKAFEALAPFLPTARAVLDQIARVTGEPMIWIEVLQEAWP